MSAPAGSARPRTVVHLLRHGEVENPGKLLYGRLPGFHLSGLGREMADMVAHHLSDRDVRLVVASSLERAQETARPIAAEHGIGVTTDDRVIEAGNKFEGLTFGVGDGSLTHPEHWAKMVNPFTPSWGEPYTRIAARMSAAVAGARGAARGHEAVLVSHQLPIWTARRFLEGRPLWHDPRRRQCALASLTTLTYRGDQLQSIGYSEPAASLLGAASQRAGA